MNRPQGLRPAHDIRGRAPANAERLSEYFDFQRWPDKATMRVTRLELLAIVTQIERARDARTLGGFLRRVWRFLKRPLGSPITDETGVASPEVNAK
jgi:hypothetical protein